MMIRLLLIFTSTLTPEAESWLEKGIEASHVEDYQTARSAYAQAKKLCPDDPAPYFLNGALTFIYMSDFVTDSLEWHFDQEMDKAEQLARAGLKENGDNARDLLFLGSVRIFQAVRYGWKRQFLKALSVGTNAIDPLLKAVELDPELYDAYLAKGAFDYFNGNLGRYIPGMKKDPETVEKGIDEIRLVYNNGFYFQASAGQALIFMLKEEGRPSQALAVSKELVSKYPSSRTFRWSLGDLYIDLEMWNEAKALYEPFLEEIRQTQPKCYTNIYQVKLCLAETYAGLGREDITRKYCEEIVNNAYRIRRDLGYSDIVKDAEKLLRNLDD